MFADDLFTLGARLICAAGGYKATLADTACTPCPAGALCAPSFGTLSVWLCCRHGQYRDWRCELDRVCLLWRWFVPLSRYLQYFILPSFTARRHILRSRCGFLFCLWSWLLVPRRDKQTTLLARNSERQYRFHCVQRVHRLQYRYEVLVVVVIECDRLSFCCGCRYLCCVLCGKLHTSGGHSQLHWSVNIVSSD